MNLTQKKTEEVILGVLGEEGLRLVRELKNRENLSEFTLSTKLKKDIKIVRNLLYKLYNFNLVSSTRKKDKQKGWYIYYWTILPENIKFLYLKNKRNLLQKLKEQVQKERTEVFYTCLKKCVRLDFDHSLEFEFRCPECGELITQDHNLSLIPELEKKIKNIEQELIEEEALPKKVGKKKKKTISKKSSKKSPIIKKKK